ncbi:MAG: hypothetical protein D4R55_01500 [Chitinophagaceae bacterium]|jgi:hypothetical protein|nr:hypothetical protein [Sphingobacteriales bacterium]TSA43051.1 MAG: hypothetical protein D4R55_01500 [Chitinophagaceae bacterium]
MQQFLRIFILIVTALGSVLMAGAQCSVCTKTAMQLGEKPAQGLNQGILYLMFIPFLIIGYIAFRWWKNHKQLEQEQDQALQG